MVKNIIVMCVLGICLWACEPQTGTKAGKEGVKNDTVENDTVDSRQGKGEGEVGDRVYGR